MACSSAFALSLLAPALASSTSSDELTVRGKATNKRKTQAASLSSERVYAATNCVGTGNEKLKSSSADSNVHSHGVPCPWLLLHLPSHSPGGSGAQGPHPARPSYTSKEAERRQGTETVGEGLLFFFFAQRTRIWAVEEHQTRNP